MAMDIVITPFQKPPKINQIIFIRKRTNLLDSSLLEKTIMNNINDYLVENVWQDLNGQVSREQIGRVVAEITLGFQDVTVKSFGCVSFT